MMLITSLIGYLGSVLGFCFLTLAIGESSLLVALAAPPPPRVCESMGGVRE